MAMVAREGGTQKGVTNHWTEVDSTGLMKIEHTYKTSS